VVVVGTNGRVKKKEKENEADNSGPSGPIQIVVFKGAKKGNAVELTSR